jgi:PST family polysaccharide transporter
MGRTLFRGTAYLIGGRVARTTITISGIAVLARLLSPADFGVVAVAALILSLANALLDGLIDVPTVREDSLDRAGLANLIWVGVTLMSGLAAALWLVAPGLEHLLNSPRLGGALRVLSFGLLLQPFVAASHSLLRREHRFQVSALFMPLSGTVYVLSAISLALLGFGLWSLIFGQIASLLVAGAWLVSRSGIPMLPPRRLRAGVAWRLGGLGSATRLLAWLSANIDTLAASVALGAAGAGLYSRAYNITTQMKEPFAALDQTLRQAFVAQRSLDNAAAARYTQAGLRLVVLAAAIFVAGVIVLREPLVALLLGPQWGGVALPLSILAAALPARVARLYLDGLSYARGSVRYMVARNVANVALLAVGLWLWAADGVTAIALVVAATHVMRLLFTGDAVDTEIGGTLAQRLHAMSPGALAAFATVCAAEWVSAALVVSGTYQDYSLRFAVYCCLVALGTMFCPRDWFPNSLERRLPRIVGLFVRTSSK